MKMNYTETFLLLISLTHTEEIALKYRKKDKTSNGYGLMNDTLKQIDFWPKALSQTTK